MKKDIMIVSLLCCVNCASAYSQYVPRYQVKTVDVKPIVFTPIEYTSNMPTVPTYAQPNYDRSRKKGIELGDSWEVANIYEKKKVPDNSKAIPKYGNLSDVEYLLVPCDINEDSYVITIKPVTSYSGLLYEVVDQDYYVEITNTIFHPCNAIVKPTAKVLLKKEYSTWIIYEIK